MEQIKNLSRLKRALTPGTVFTIIKHNYHAEYTGQRRRVNIANTQGVFSVDPDNPQSFVSTANCGKGFWLAFGTAKEWSFAPEQGLCSLYKKGTWHTPDNLIMSFKLEAQADEH